MDTTHKWKSDYGCVKQEALRYCRLAEHHGHVIYVWENTANIVDICTFVHAINNLVLFRLQPLGKIFDSY